MPLGRLGCEMISWRIFVGIVSVLWVAGGCGNEIESECAAPAGVYEKTYTPQSGDCVRSVLEAYYGEASDFQLNTPQTECGEVTLTSSQQFELQGGDTTDTCTADEVIYTKAMEDGLAEGNATLMLSCVSSNTADYECTHQLLVGFQRESASSP